MPNETEPIDRPIFRTPAEALALVLDLANADRRELFLQALRARHADTASAMPEVPPPAHAYP